MQGAPRIFDAMVNRLGLQIDCDASENLPASGPAIVVANHPFGALESIILGFLLSKIRADFRFLGSFLFQALPDISPLVIPVHPPPIPNADLLNRVAIRNSLQHLRSGGLLVLFPSGEAGEFSFSKLRPVERPWSAIAASLMNLSRASAIPVFLHGRNSWFFYAASRLHTDVGTVLCAREVMRRAGSTIRVSIGEPITPSEALFKNGLRPATQYLREQTLALSERRKSPGFTAASGSQFSGHAARARSAYKNGSPLEFLRKE